MSSAPRRDARRTLAAAALGLLAICVAALLLGTERVSLVRALSEPASLDAAIVLRARLPRVALAGIAGAGLGVVGGGRQPHTDLGEGEGGEGGGRAG